ncbi:hypothetical protein ACH4TV_03420 [Streptomyces sp. NPDC020898]|uniref:hypothetical protein n=1 Tax=Streptomyces sp. NPDC020898 TaxID=3365101 RepID=UPI00379BD916
MKQPCAGAGRAGVRSGSERRVEGLVSPPRAWAAAFQAEARSELDDLHGELLIECYDKSSPAAGTGPVHSAEVPLGPGRPFM